MQDKIMELVSQICNTESTNCRSLNKVDIARKLLNIANVPTTAEIQEIPLDCNNQVVILFLLPNDINYYSLFAGIGTDSNFHFELAIAGTLDGNMFNFYDEDKEIDIDYFVNNTMQDKPVLQRCDNVLINYNTESNLQKVATFLESDNNGNNLFMDFSGKFILTDNFINRQGITIEVLAD